MAGTLRFPVCCLCKKRRSLPLDLFVCNALARSVCVCRPGKGSEITLQHTACQACPAYLLGVFHLVIQDLTRLEILPSPEDWPSATIKEERNAQRSVTIVWFNTQGTGKTQRSWGEDGNVPAKPEGPSVPPWVLLRREHALLPDRPPGAPHHLTSAGTAVADDISQGWCLVSRGLPRPAMLRPYRLPWTPFLSRGDLWLNNQGISSCFVPWSETHEKNMALAGCKFEA